MNISNSNKNEVITYILLQICAFIASIGLAVSTFISTIPLLLMGIGFLGFYPIAFAVFRIILCKPAYNILVKTHGEQVASKRLKVAIAMCSVVEFLLMVFLNWILFEFVSTNLYEQTGGFSKNIFKYMYEIVFDLVKLVCEKGDIFTKMVLTFYPVFVWLHMNFLIDRKKEKDN